MSTQKTSAYQLNPWVKSDRILMEEFNEDNRIIDAALSSISAAAGNCRIAIGSYVGTGLCGESNPCSLTFDFQPLMVFLNTGGANFQSNLPIQYMMTRPQTTFCYSFTETGKVAWSENGVTWHNDTAKNQLNDADRIYYYIAIGK